MTNIQSPASVRMCQKYIAELCALRGWDKNSPTELMLLLTEEIGELAKAIRNREGLYTESGKDQFDPKELEHELADVFSYLLDIANLYKVDLESAFIEKQKKNEDRDWSAYSNE